MRSRYFATICALAVVGFAPRVAVDQTAAPKGASKPAGSASKWTPAHTAWGDPDIQGLWNNSTTTPLERPNALGTRQFLTPQEIEEELAAQIRKRDAPPVTGDTGTYNYVWMENGKSLNRTSLIVDPPDGRLPPMTPTAEKAYAEWVANRRLHPADAWDDINLATRCLTRGAPKNPGGYNNNFLILQTPGQVTILQEMIHEVRVIPLDGRPHLNKNVYLWMGDSRGHWEGDTLVVDTTNYNDKIINLSYNCCPGAGANLHVIERFKRVGPDDIEYSYTVDDPATWTRQWTASVPLNKSAGPMFEYACHEGNHAMIGILGGARAQEAAKSGSTGSK